MNENEILLKFSLLNNLPIGFKYRKSIEGTKFNLYLIPKWMSGKDKDEWFNNRLINSKLKLLGLTTQLYYDIMELRISNVSQRPICNSDICNNTCKFYGLLRGYGSTCSISCRSRVSDLDPRKNKKLRETFCISRRGMSNSDSHRYKCSLKLKGRLISSETRELISKSMLEKYKDPEEILKRIKTNKKTRTRKGWISISKSREDIYYGSSWEKFLIELCESSDEVECVKRCNVINYVFNGKSKRYLPDLHVILKSGLNIIFEVKPYRELKDPKVMSKAKYAIDYCKDFKNFEYRFFTEKDIKLAKQGKFKFN